MSKMDAAAKRIVALAYFHRYGWIVAMMICWAIWPKRFYLILCLACLTYSVWSFVGYKCRWRHIYCSFQDAYHQSMTPHNVRWHQIRVIDAYGEPLIFLILGLALLAVILH